jgi:hypothetical protein
VWSVTGDDAIRAESRRSQTAPVLADVHRLLSVLSADERESLWQRELEHVRRLKAASHFDAALELVADTVMPALPAESVWRLEFCVDAAEACRRTYRWQEAAHWLARAGAALDNSRGTPRHAHQRTLVAANDALLQLARGLPELAAAAAATCRQAVAGATAENPWRAADDWLAAFVDLRVLHALDHAEGAARVLADYEAAHGVNHGLRIRAALAILQDRRATAEHATATAWLQQAAAAHTSADERLLARTRLVIRWLDAGDMAAAAAELQPALAQLPTTASPDERRVGLLALALRHALDAGLPPATVQQRWQDLQSVWLDVLARREGQPVERSGLGPLFSPEMQRALGELVRARLVLDGDAGPATALQCVLAVEARGTMARAAGARAVDVETVRDRVCSEGTGLLLYVAAREQTFVFALDARVLRAFTVPAGVWRLDRATRELREAIQRHRRDPAAARTELDRCVADLSAVLLPADLCALIAGWRTIAIVGLETLGYVPFELLHLSDGRRLGLHFGIGYLPSATVGVWLRERATRSPLPEAARALCIACPDARPLDPRDVGEGPLPFDASDAGLLSEAAGTDVLTVLRGADATLARAAPLLPYLRVLSVLAHGVRDESRLDPQGVLLGDGRPAWTSDFEAMALPSHVVFAACRAGRGRLRRGDDGRHLLGGAAMLAGATTVIAPSLDVGYRDALALLAELHRGALQHGLPIGEALRRARVAVAGADGSRSLEPFLFHLHGLADERAVAAPLTADAPARIAWPWLLAVAAVVAAALAWWLGRARRTGPA